MIDYLESRRLRGIRQASGEDFGTPAEDCGVLIRRRANNRSNEPLRVHIWPMTERVCADPLWPIHDHVWDMKSFIACGELKNHVYETIPVPNGDHQFYRAHYYDGGRSSLVAEGNCVKMRRVSEQRYVAGNTYRVRRGTLHSTAVSPRQLTATVVLATQPEGLPRVVGDASFPRRVDFSRSACTDSEVRRLLGAVIDRM